MINLIYLTRGIKRFALILNSHDTIMNWKFSCINIHLGSVKEPLIRKQSRIMVNTRQLSLAFHIWAALCRHQRNLTLCHNLFKNRTSKFFSLIIMLCRGSTNCKMIYTCISFFWKRSCACVIFSFNNKSPLISKLSKSTW